MRQAGPVVLTLSVVLAGCSGLPAVGGSGGPAPTVTPVPVDQFPALLPPGVSEDGVELPGRLGDAHDRAIDGRSYVLTSNRTVRYANGTLSSSIATRVALDEDRQFLASVATAGPDAPVLLGRPPATAVYWSDGTTNLRRLTRDGRTTYTEFEPPEPWIGGWYYWVATVPFGGRDSRPETFYAGLFSAVPTRLAGRTSLEGTTVFRLEAAGDQPVDDGFPGDVSSVRNVTLVAHVDGDGLVRTLDLRYEGTLDGEPVRVHRTVRYRHVGSTTVERPAWYDRAASG